MKLSEAEGAPRAGRPRKDPALKLRDRYVATWLKLNGGGRTLSSLERDLHPSLLLRERGDGQGVSQPGALDKAARGVRGLSANFELPQIVRGAEVVAPGAIAAFSSPLWLALCNSPQQGFNRELERSAAQLCLRRRFAQHCSSLTAAKRGLCTVRRLGRIWHRDALGHLLLLCRAETPTEESVLAELHIANSLHRACQGCLALQQIHTELEALIELRFRGVLALGQRSVGKVFPGIRISQIGVALRMLMRQPPSQ
jgi:hypothetical protein